MAEAPSPADVARMILDRFKSLDSRSGNELPANHIAAIQVANHLSESEMNAGLQYAGEQGWIEIENTNNLSIQLTESGFAEMRSSVPTGPER